MDSKKQIWVGKPSNWSHGHMLHNAYYRNLKRTLQDLLRCYCYAIKPNSQSIRSQVSQTASAVKEADVTEQQDHQYMTPEE